MNHCQISRRTGIPRPTVRDWVTGKTRAAENTEREAATSAVTRGMTLRNFPGTNTSICSACISATDASRRWPKGSMPCGCFRT
ncbi:MAG: hypothetical protein ACRDF6_13785 [bacterium]